MPDLKSLSKIGLITAGLILSLFTALQAQQSHTILLAGYKQVPPVPSPGSGSVTVMLNGDTLAVNGYFKQLSSSYYGAFIHFGSEDERGNQLFRLEADLNKDKTGGTFDPERNQWKLTESQLQTLAEGRLYINIYSVDYTNGELRGQIPPMKHP